MIAYLNSLYFSNKNRHIIHNFWSWELKDMNFAKLEQFLKSKTARERKNSLRAHLGQLLGLLSRAVEQTGTKAFCAREKAWW